MDVDAREMAEEREGHARADGGGGEDGGKDADDGVACLRLSVGLGRKGFGSVEILHGVAHRNNIRFVNLKSIAIRYKEFKNLKAQQTN
jgi:hypothetical protein